MSNKDKLIAKIPDIPASGPNNPPVHHFGPVDCMDRMDAADDKPLTLNPNTPPKIKFQALCNPTERAKLPVQTNGKASKRPANIMVKKVMIDTFGLNR